jgi:hypothetical protein
MYKARKVEGGWQVFRDEPDTEPVLIPRIKKGKVTPYPFKQGAYRKAKQLNDAVKEVDTMLARDGASIV